MPLTNPFASPEMRGIESEQAAAEQELRGRMNESHREFMLQADQSVVDQTVTKFASELVNQRRISRGEQTIQNDLAQPFPQSGLAKGAQETAQGFRAAVTGERPELTDILIPGVTTALALSPYGRFGAKAALSVARGGYLMASPAVQTGIRGALGAAAGGLLAEKIKNDTPTLESYLKAAVKESALELGGQSIAQVPTLLKARFAAWSGLGSQAADDVIESATLANAAARRAGIQEPIELTVQDVATHAVIRGARNVLGRFGITNKPFKEAGKRQAVGLSKAKDRVLMELSPIVESLIAKTRGNPEAASRAAGRISTRLFEQGKKASDLFRRLAREKYGNVKKLAGDEDLDVPLASLLATMEHELRSLISDSPTFLKLSQELGLSTLEFDAKTLFLTMRQGTPKQLIKIQEALDPELIELIKKMDGWLNGVGKEAVRLGPVQSFAQAGSVAADIGEFIARTEGNKASTVYQALKKAVRDDIKRAVSTDGSEALQKAFTEADGFFTDNWNLFTRSPGSRRLKTLLGDFGSKEQREIVVGLGEDASRITGGSGRGGESSSVAVLISRATSQELLDLRNILSLTGGEATPVWKDAVGLHFTELWDSAIKTVPNAGGAQLFDAKILRKSLGFTSPLGSEMKKTRILFKGTGVNVGEVDSVLKLTEQLFKDGVPNLSDMITRRAILGGIQSAIRTLLPGTDFNMLKRGGNESVVMDALGVAKIYAGWWLTRTKVGGQLLTDPATLKTLRTLLNDRFGPEAQMMALQKLARIRPIMFSIDAIADIGLLESATPAATAAMETTLGGIEFLKEKASAGVDRLRGVDAPFPDFSRETGEIPFPNLNR